MAPDRTDHIALDALTSWTFEQLTPAAAQWLRNVQASAAETRSIDIAFGLAPRKTGRDTLSLDTDVRASAESLIPGWQPYRWRIDEAARLLIASSGLKHEPGTLDRLIRHADVDEQCAIYRGLCVLPTNMDMHDLVGRGLRTHATPVFEAIAHHNPWTLVHFDEHRWNHLVLKAMFMEVSLWPISGFDERRNPELARMALDFAAERLAADRPVPSEIFRCLAPYISLSDIKPYLPQVPWNDTVATRAASLALLQASDTQVIDYVKSHSPHLDAIESNALDWQNHTDN